MGNLENTLENMLFDLGIYQNRRGFTCIIVAIRLVEKHPEYLKSLTTALYPAVARQVGCSAPAVERNIRYALTCAWDSDSAPFSRLARRTVTQPPTVGDFLCMLCNYMERQQKKPSGGGSMLST